MAEKRKLVINKGEEFKLSIRNKIDRSDIFYNQYCLYLRINEPNRRKFFL